MTATVCDITANHRKHMSCDPYTLLCDVVVHALYNNGPCVDTKKTLPQYCCVAHVGMCLLGCCLAMLEQIRHNIFKT
jgi:hypothetical protein